MELISNLGAPIMYFGNEIELLSVPAKHRASLKIDLSEYFVQLHGYLFCRRKLSDQTWWVLLAHHPLNFFHKNVGKIIQLGCFIPGEKMSSIYNLDLWNDPIFPSVFTFVNPEPMSISTTEILSPWKTVISLPDCALFMISITFSF